MKIGTIVEMLNARVLCGEDKLDSVVNSACGCDMMSDVLAFVKEQAVLLTGLCNPQVMIQRRSSPPVGGEGGSYETRRRQRNRCAAVTGVFRKKFSADAGHSSV